MVAGLLARFIGSYSMYFCVGGPAEVINGGSLSENRLFRKIDKPDPIIERRLIEAVKDFDLVITMGEGAISFFRQHGVDAQFHIVSGGIDGSLFYPSELPPSG